MKHSNRKVKLAVLVTHPVQYFQPVFKELSAQPGIDLLVVYACNHGLTHSYDPDFQSDIAWDSDVISGFRSTFLSHYKLSSLSSFFPSFCLAFKASRVISDFNADFTLVYSYTPVFISLSTLILKLSGKHLYLRADGTDRALPRGSLKSFIRDVILYIWYKLFRHIFPIGSDSDRHFARLGVVEDRRTPISFAVNYDFFDIQSKFWMTRRESIRSMYGIRKDNIVLLWSAKMTSIKNPMLLINALAMLPPHIKKRIFLVAMGDGPLRNTFQSYAVKHLNDRVCFLGFCNQSQLGRGYACSDVLIFPSSKGETWGLVVNEALQYGLAVISSDHPGCAADLLDGKIDIPYGSNVFPNHDVASLSNLISIFANIYHDGYLPKPVKGLPRPIDLVMAIKDQIFKDSECNANHSPNTIHRQ